MQSRTRLVLFLILLIIPFSVQARYSDISFNQTGSTFCGLLDDGHAECFTTNYREPALVNGDPNQTYTQIDVGSYFACGITSSADVACWGDNVDDILNTIPQFDFPVIALSVDGYYVCAVDSGTNVKCWGQNVTGQASPPEDATGFLDVSTSFSHACGLKTDSTVECWGTRASGTIEPALSVVPSEITDLTSIDIRNVGFRNDVPVSTDVHCGIRAGGNAVCWHNDTGVTVAELISGPYKKVGIIDGSTDSFICAETLNGEIDCTSSSLSRTGSSGSLPTVERLPGTYLATDYSLYRTLCGYTTENRLECPRGFTDSGNINRTLQLVNSEWPMPTIVITDAEYYGYGIEIFYDTLFASDNNNFYDNYLFYDYEIFRDGEFLTATENERSYVDRTVEDGREYVYSIRAVHLYGQPGETSGGVSIQTSTTETALNDNPQVNRPSEPGGLRAEIYWFDIELFWDRDTSGNVRNYEIRRNGELITTTRGTSWYDDSTVSGERYVYDVIAVGHDNNILGFRSVPVKIGALECS